MRRIELMGPPGVGKTTIFNAACVARNGSGAFRRVDELRRIWNASPWPEFGAFVDAAYAKCPADEPKHARRLRVTQRALRRAHTIAATQGNAPVLVDESLCQRGLSLALSKPGGEDVWKYFEIMPAPAAVIVVLADCDTIKARNVARGGNGSGMDRSADALACYVACGIAVTQLRKRSVAVIEIDAGATVAASVVRLLDGMKALA